MMVHAMIACGAIFANLAAVKVELGAWRRPAES